MKGKLAILKNAGAKSTKLSAPHLDIIWQCLAPWECGDVRLEALKKLGMLTPEVLAPRVGVILQCLAPWECGDLKLEALKVLSMLTPEVLALRVDIVLPCVARNEYSAVRLEALKVLGRLTPEVLAPHVGGILRHFAHDEPGYVKLEAWKVLGMLTPEVLAPHVGVILRCSAHDESGDLKLEALKVLGMLTPEALAPHVGVILRYLAHDERVDVKLEAQTVLGMLAPEVLAPHVGVILPCLDHDECGEVKFEALRVLGMLTPEVLAPHVDVILRCSARQEGADVEYEARKVLGMLTPEVLAPHVGVILRCLAHREGGYVKIEVRKLLGMLTPEVLSPHVGVILRCLAHDECDDVKLEARKVLGMLTPEVLAPHVGVILQCLAHDECGDVQLEALKVLGMLAPEVLARYSLWSDCHGNSLLHLAANRARADLCKIFQKAGVPLKMRNSHGQIAEDIAKRHGCEEVFDFLQSCNSMTMCRIGAGDAWREAVTDDRHVVEVQWLTIPVSGWASSIGVLHSLIRVTVADSKACHVYVIEKAALSVQKQGVEQFQNGVHISHWSDVCSQIEGSSHHDGRRDDIIGDLLMRDLWNTAVSTGPYDVSNSNCHNACFAVFNFCVRESAKVNHIPNAWLAQCASLLKAVGLPVEASQSTSCHSESTSGPVASGMASNCNEELSFPMSGDLVEAAGRNHPWTRTAAELSRWIYEPVLDNSIAFANATEETVAIYLEEIDKEIRVPPGRSQHLPLEIEKVHVRLNRLGLMGLTSWRTRLARLRVCKGQLYEVRRTMDGAAECKPKHLLPSGMRIRHLQIMTDGNLVQWAVVTTEEAVFIVFKGTSNVFDLIVNGGCISNDEANHGLRVHSGMWAALHQSRNHTFNSVRAELQKLQDEQNVLKATTTARSITGSSSSSSNRRRESCVWAAAAALAGSLCRKSKGRPLVLCGHSLGGGYALLTALELLYQQVPLAAVVTFGAPQVIVPDHCSPLWRKLNDISTLFINAYDVIPRLPSCLPWLFDVLPKSRLLAMRTGPLTFSLDISADFVVKQLGAHKEAVEDYDTVGTLMFLSAGSTRARKLSSTNGEHRKVLGRVPVPTGPFVFEHHEMAAYLRIISSLSSST